MVPLCEPDSWALGRMKNLDTCTQFVTVLLRTIAALIGKAINYPLYGEFGLCLGHLKVSGLEGGGYRHFGILLACIFSSTSWCYERGCVLWSLAHGFVFISAGVGHLPHYSWVCSWIGNSVIPTCLPGEHKSGFEFTICGLFIKPNYNVQRNLLSEAQENQGMNEWTGKPVFFLIVSAFLVWS